MKTYQLIYLLGGAFLLSTSMGFVSLPQEGVSQRNIFAATPTILQTAQRRKIRRPPTKTTTISVEGEKTQVTLNLYEQANSKFSTYIPEKDFIASSSGSDEGTGVRFIANFGGYKNEKEYIHFFFPSGKTNLQQIRNRVTGKRGLLSLNGWQVSSTNRHLPYSWAKERISFREPKSKENIIGNVILGEYKGKAFYVITHYPAEYGDGFQPRANIIFQNLQFSD